MIFIIIFKMDNFYLEDYSVRDSSNPISHVALNGGRFFIPGEKYLDLFHYISKNPHICLSELLTDIFPLFFDIDDLEHDLSIEEVNQFIVKGIKKVLEVTDAQCKYDITKNSTKEKYHIYYTKIYVTKETANLIADVIQNDIKQECDLDNIIDKAPYNSGLRMHGTLKYSHKTKASVPGTNYEFLTPKPSKCKSLEKEMKYLCLRRAKPQTLLKKQFQIKKKDDKKKKEKKKEDIKKIRIEALKNQVIDHSEIETLLFKCLNYDRCDDFNDWLKIGYILKNEGVPVETFIKWSETSPKFDEEHCRKIYNNEENDSKTPITIATLYRFAKEDNPQEFEKLNYGKGVSKYENIYSIPDDFIKKCYYKEDLGDAELFARMYKGRIIGTGGKKTQYYYWDGNLWQLDNSSYMKVLIATHLPEIYKQYAFSLMRNINNEEDMEAITKVKDSILKRAKLCATNKHVSDILPFLASELFDEDLQSKFNSDKTMLSIKGGVLSLKTGKFRPRKLDDYCTFELDVEFKGLNYPTNDVEQFFQEIMLNNNDMVRYLQSLLGYSITGYLTEQKFLVFWGALGSNGKSVLIELMRNLLEEKKYYASLSGDALMNIKKTSPGSATPHLTALYGSRVAFLDESEKKAVLNEAIVKRITGNSMVTIRRLYGAEFSFESMCQPILVTNFRPQITTDNAMHRRLILIPFDAIFKSEEEFDKNNPRHKIKDNDKLDKLKNCKDQLLIWLLKGSMEWFNNKLPEFPEKIKEITNEYKSSGNPVLSFIKETCELPSDPTNVDTDYYFTSEKELLEAYIEYSEEKIKRKEFKEYMVKLGYKRVRINGKFGYKIYHEDDDVCLIQDD